MEIHVRNVPSQSTENSLKSFLRPVFIRLNIRAVHCQKYRDKNYATLTFLHLTDAQTFLLHHGQSARPQAQTIVKRDPVRQPTRAIYLRFLGHFIYCSQSRYDPNPYLRRVLAKEEKDRAMRSTTTTNLTHSNAKILPIFFHCSTISCGVWNYAGPSLFYEPQVTWRTAGTAKFGERSMILTLDSGLRIDFLYFSTLCIATEEGKTPSLIFSMREPPRFYEKIVFDPLIDLMSQLGIQANAISPHRRRNGAERHRLPCLSDSHQSVAGTCFVYRIALQTDATSPADNFHIANRMQALRDAHELPHIIHRQTQVVLPRQTVADGLRQLRASLAKSGYIPFAVAFQLQKLAQDGYLPPQTVLNMLPEIEKMAIRAPIPVCVKAIRKLFNQIPFLGPESEATEFQMVELLEWLKENEEKCQREEDAIDIGKHQSKNIATIHRVKITPSAIRLCGPERESNNRVLRKYPDHHEYFLRVQFSDEDGEQVRFNPRISNEKIFHERFKDVLRKGISIAGREYAFLGFSHSSLRAQSCWFMAPFIHEGALIWDQILIKDLGNFAVIQSPAKCAARIGQVFSDTRTAVTIDTSLTRRQPDVERNGRVFSDGVGTMSEAMMKKIWESLPRARLVKPTLFQIRYQGAKGMISLDTRLKGECLVLRDSMIKFDGSTWPDIEICKAAYKPLKMYLNRQFIKILEDMGVEDSFFLDLQAEEVRYLRMITKSPLNASTFLKRQTIGGPILLPAFINQLAALNLDFRKDGFLRDVLEMALLVELRLLKHKTRIPVDQGWHLHGIMDETGFLDEGQIYCSAIIDGVPLALNKKKVIITKAPALHPGDIQLADAVIPPPGSPLAELTNCIAFSSKGSRDLPSQLSGGDLDGDRFFVMWDDNALPKRTFASADYARQTAIDIGRTVETSDMTDHFIQFMETDQLGRIAVNHRILADQEPSGTLHIDCITLAEMHSTAVDFSKTGIPIDPSRFPRYNSKWRPDFEAPGPHVTIEKKGGLSMEEVDNVDPDERGDEDDDFTAYRYYESQKILGKLYRAIDEREVFEHVKHRSLYPDISSQSTVINAVWEHVQRKCAVFQWEHHREWARYIRAMYEENLQEIMINHSDHTLHPVSELEAFIGNILGRTGAQNRTQRELSTTMKENFDEHSAFIVNCIVKDDTEWSEESLERSMACLAVSLETREGVQRYDRLLSFKYITAAVCLREVERMGAGL